MNEQTTVIDRRTYLATVGTAAAGMAGFAGCLGEATGSLATHVTDQPGDIGDFQTCIVTITGMWLAPTGTDEENSDDREYIAYDEPQTADLVELQDESTQLVDERELEVATYEFLQLDIDAVDATLKDGSDATVQVPGDAPLKFAERFDIREDTRTTFTADIVPIERGQAGGYNLRPVADGVTVTYEDGSS